MVVRLYLGAHIKEINFDFSNQFVIFAYVKLNKPLCKLWQQNGNLKKKI